MDANSGDGPTSTPRLLPTRKAWPSAGPPSSRRPRSASRSELHRARHAEMSVKPGVRGSEMRNYGHRDCERDWISDRGARRRRFARLKEVLKNTGLGRRAVDRRLV